MSESRLKEHGLQELLTPQEVCAWLKIEMSTLYHWVSNDKIPSVKVGNLRRFEPEELRKWKKRRTSAA